MAGVSILPAPDGWTDPLTGTEGPRFWEHILANEDARLHRYRRTATVALVEFAGFEHDSGWLGNELSLELFGGLARVLVHEVRTSDHLARIGPARFGIILVETDEVRAINFVDRVRDACRRELGAATGFGVRIGWASPSETGSLEDALVTAAARLDQEALQGARDTRDD